jgi:serine/threonine-protein kinase
MSLVGHRIGRYRILEEVGSGGMSVVYKGLDTALDREVAVKVLHPHLAGREDSRKRLAREAKAVAKLQHPNILEVFDFVTADPQNAYIVTEYIRGQTLRQYAEQRAFDPPEIAAMVIHEVAAALAHAHDAGIIHRDLKPENVMVRDDGVIKLMDFGIAKILDREERMTMTGALVGSPAHMAPEIVEGQEVGPEADVFSLGTMLYYFSTGRLPFSGPNATATLKKILDGSYEDPRKLAPAVSDGLTEIIATCLARQPSARYQNARRLQEALSAYLASAGFARPGDELGWFFLDQAAYRAQMVSRLVENRLESAAQLMGEKRPAKALSCLNQVLALDPGSARARQLLAEMNRTRRLRSAARRGLVVLGLSAAAIALCTGALLWRDRGIQARAAVRFPPAGESAPPASAHTEDPIAMAPTESPTAPAAPAAPGAQPSIATRDRVKTPHPAQKPATNFKLTLLFRPYAYVQIDGGQRRDEMTQHELQLAPGVHRLVYGCRFCEEETTTLDVAADNQTVRLLVQPKPSTVVFRYEPPDAEIKVGEVVKTAEDAQHTPFRISFPKGVTQQRVKYEITREGFRPRTDEISLMPGESKVLEGRLERE